MTLESQVAWETQEEGKAVVCTSDPLAYVTRVSPSSCYDECALAMHDTALMTRLGLDCVARVGGKTRP